MSTYQTRYQGDILALDGSSWTIQIQQLADEPFESIGALSFDADTPLEIEWIRRSKEDCLCGSIATLKLISPGDRTYIDLYSIAPCEYRLLVWRNDDLYWSGTLDPESYEEPYNSSANYDVRLTFSDFGVLDRIPYSQSGLVTLEDIFEAALSESGLLYNSIDQSLISTYYIESGASHTISLSSLAVRSDNFFDEDGVAMSLYDVIEGILQPLGIRVVQRGGVIHLYDLNGMYNDASSRSIVWAADDQLLSSDVVYNKVKVSLSAYGGNSKSEDIEFTGQFSPSMINLTNLVPPDGRYWSYFENWGEELAVENTDFTILLGSGDGLSYVHPSADYFHILPLLGGEESSGVAIWFYTGGHGALGGTAQLPVRKGFADIPLDGVELMSTKSFYLPPLDDDTARLYALRLTLPMLLDARYNPFQDAGEYNEKKWAENFGKLGDFFVPVKVEIYNASGTVVSHYCNKYIAQGTGLTARRKSTQGVWEAGSASYDDCYLQWYDPTQDNGNGAVQGWKTNHQTAGLRRSIVYRSVKELPDGQHIPYPSVGGYLKVTVCGGMRINFDEDSDSDYGLAATINLLRHARWMLFKTPQITIEKNDIVGSEIDTSDVEYSGIVNPDAKEELELSTICGTISPSNPMARASYFSAFDGAMIQALSRAGRTSQVEQLLIGTMHSQYTERKMVLSGTADLDTGDFELLVDSAMPSGKKFLCLSEVHRIRESENMIVAVELRPDEYVSNDD